MLDCGVRSSLDAHCWTAGSVALQMPIAGKLDVRFSIWPLASEEPHIQLDLVVL